jgi:hypothetical protein
MTKEETGKLKQRIAALKENSGIDLGNVDKCTNDAWLFLTSDYMPSKATIKKEAFDHEVSVMIDMCRQHYAKQQSIAFKLWCDKNKWLINNATEFYSLTADGYVIMSHDHLYGLFLEQQPQPQ